MDFTTFIISFTCGAVTATCWIVIAHVAKREAQMKRESR